MKITVLFVTLIAGCQAGFGIVGGWSDADVNDHNVKAALDEAKGTFENSNGGFEAKHTTVTAEQQLVNGINYRFRLKFTDSTNDCKTKTCDFHVWRNFSGDMGPVTMHCEPVTMHCDNSISKRSLRSNSTPLGGSRKTSPTDPDVVNAANFAVDELNAQMNNLYRSMLLRITHVRKQNVAGIKYKILVTIADSTCRNTAELNHVSLEQCPVTSQEYKECTVVVLDQQWMSPRYSLDSFTCGARQSSKVTPAPKPADKAVLGGDGTDIGHHGDFLVFMKTYNKSYVNNAEHQKRFSIFRENMAKAVKLQEKDLGDARYGASVFADLSEEEFRMNYLNPEWDLSYDPSLMEAEIPEGTPPITFDWRDHGAVTPVKNQGSCGSCWAFSTTGNVEGQWAIKKKQLLSLSEQELVDCDKLDDGCEGGLPTNAYKEIQRLGGLETEKDYPYDGHDDKCSFQKNDSRVQINGAVNISSDEGDMAAWLAENGPISIGINAMAMQFYMGGVSHPWSIFCNPSSLDHGVLIVGYAVKKGIFSDTPYWIVKNSWGPSWGEKGYYLVYRGAGVCGLNKMPTSAVVN